jgi:CubicO group peptidase (beta-lactamase class C family)
MLLGEGELDGVRLLGTRTVRYMSQNHLPGGVDLEAFGRPLFAETTYDGVGFGLGFSVVDDPVKNKVLSSEGEYAWGGAASTAFWVDPLERITAVFMTQLLPSSTHPIRSQLKQLVYQALVD